MIKMEEAREILRAAMVIVSDSVLADELDQVSILLDSMAQLIEQQEERIAIMTEDEHAEEDIEWPPIDEDDGLLMLGDDEPPNEGDELW